MKTYFLMFIFLLGWVATGNCQTDEVSFIHGLRDNTIVWNPMDNKLSSDFNYSRFDVSYTSTDAVSSSASSVYIPDGTVAVAHSLGGYWHGNICASAAQAA